MRFPLVLIFLTAFACGGDEGPSDPGNGNNPPPPPSEPTLSSVTCTLDAIADVEYEGATRPSVDFAWSGEGVMSDGSTTALDSAVVRVGSVRIQKFTGGISGSGTLGSGDTSDGNNTLSITCYRATRTGADSAGFGIFRLVTLSFEATHFFSQEPNLTGTTVTVKQGTDTRNLSLTDGTGSLTVRAGTNQIQIQDSDSGQLHYLEEVGAAPGEHLVFDRQNLPQTIEVAGDTGYEIVSVDDEQFLEEMGRQWTFIARVPAPGTIKLVLYSSGNPTCPEFWTPERSDPAFNMCGDIETWPPGKSFTQDQINNFLQFVDDTRALFENPIIPWTPYSIESVLADSVSIQEYVDAVSLPLALAEVKMRNTLVVIGTGFPPFRERSQIDFGAPNTLFAASETSNGNLSFLYAAESQLFGRIGESDPPVCSIGDNELNLLPECPFDETTPTYYDWDEKAYAVIATYLALAQTQPNPFNVVLPAP